jgi:protein O-GlcNAc transferase
MNTTGLTRMDYRLTDEVLDPPSGVRRPVSGVKTSSSDTGHRTPDSGRFLDTEELFRLPKGMCCFGPPGDAPPVSPLPALRRSFVMFGSTHGLLKLNGSVFDVWSQLLKAVPTARLLLFRDTLTKTVQGRIRQQFYERDISGDRLEMHQGLDPARFLEIYAEIDVALDAFPCTGGVTTCEALWMGVPVVSLCGVRPASRNSAAILGRAGLASWVVQTTQDYVALGMKWANDFDGLAHLRAQLRDRVAATLCDASAFTRGLEEAYRTMWRHWCAKKESGCGEHC